VSESGSPSKPSLVAGWLLLLVGVSVFAIGLQHAGPYAFPRGGNLLGGVLALLLGGWLARAWLGAHRLATTLGIFGRSADEDTVALRLDPCPPVRAQ
jgi:hypothetical protein